MSPAAHRRGLSEHRLLVADPTCGSLVDADARDFGAHLRPGDLLVVNDAATLPASLVGELDGEAVEVRLTSGAELPRAWVVLFGEGDWRIRTEERPDPPPVSVGSRIALDGLRAEVERVSPVSPRLALVRLDASDGDALSAIYRAGRPIQYSYADGPLPLWDVQTAYAARPWAVELPSAGLPLAFEKVVELRARGVELATLTHAAGLSSTGSDALDALLPLPERFELPRATAQVVARARREGRRVVAVGTSVVRALESAVQLPGWEDGASAVTSLRIGEGFEPRLISGLLTGMHEPGTSHYDLMRAFSSASFLRELDAHAEERGYLGHEFGDHTLVLAA